MKIEHKKEITMMGIILLIVAVVALACIAIDQAINNTTDDPHMIGKVLLFHEYNENTKELKQTGIFTFCSGWSICSGIKGNYYHYTGDISIRVIPQPLTYYEPGDIINATVKDYESWFLGSDNIDIGIGSKGKGVEFYIDDEIGVWTHWSEDRFMFTITYENAPFSDVNLDISLSVINIPSEKSYIWNNEHFNIQSFDVYETRMLKEQILES